MRSYISSNATKILCIYLLALAAAALIPTSVFSTIPYDILRGRLLDNYQLVGISALVLFLIVALKERTGRFWARYKDTARAVRPQFFYHHYLIWFVTTIALLLFLKKFVDFWTFVGVGAGCALPVWAITLIRDGAGAAEGVGDESWFSDEPIKNEGYDLLGRTPFVQRLYEHITNLPFTDSFVFGLSGNLGEGKTSVINLLKRRFEGNETHVIVDYVPWNFTDEKAMLNAFYAELEKAISKNLLIPGLKRALAKYQKLLSPQISPFGIKLGFNVDESLEDVKERIEGYITRARKKLLIIIDDIDRLDPKEILQILKLVRLNAKFKNTVFVLVYDRNRVREKLKDYADVDEEYIEKFIQRHVPLPAAADKAIENYLDVHLEKLLEQLGLTAEEKKAFWDQFALIYQRQARKILRTLRKTKIYLNGLRAALPPIHKEVNIFDFAVLELIKVFYPAVHEDIWHSPEFYIPIEWSDQYYWRSPFFLERDEEVNFRRIKEHVEGAIAGEPEKDIVLDLLEAIFPIRVKRAFSRYGLGTSSTQTYRVERRLTHPESFIKYFMLEVPSSDIPDDELYRTLEQWRSAEANVRAGQVAESFFAYQKQGKLAAFLMKLNIFRDQIPPELIPPIITAVYMNTDKFSDEFGGFEHLFRSEWDRAFGLLATLIDEKVGRQNIHRFVEEAALNTPDIPLAVRLTLYSAGGRGGSLYNIYESVDIERLRAGVSERLRRHFVEGGINVFEEYPDDEDWTFIVYQWATNWMTNTGDNYRIFNDYMSGLYEADTKTLMTILNHSHRFNNPVEERQVYDVDQIREAVTRYLDEGRFGDEERSVAERFLVKYPPAQAPDVEPSEVTEEAGEEAGHADE